MQTVIEGVYAIRFNGFNREERGTRARTVAGVGQLTLTQTAGAKVASGFHRATNCPMTGQRDPDDPGASLRHTKYKLDMGKSCVRFKKTADIPYELIGELTARVSVDDWISWYEKALKR